jgi:hypothetical protein
MRTAAMTAQAKISPANSGDRQTERDGAVHLAEAAVAYPGPASDTAPVWRYWRTKWLAGDGNLHR